MTADVESLAWRKVCALVSGAALSPTVDVLRRAGALDALASATRPVRVAELASCAELHEGYTHVALLVLATQGLLHRDVRGGDTRGATVDLTPAGREWCARRDAYAHSTEQMVEARRIRARLLEGIGSGEGAAATSEPCPAAADTLDGRLSLHARGAVVSAIMGALGRTGTLRALHRAPLGWGVLEDLPPPTDALAEALPHVEALGWIARDGDLVSLTPEGLGAARWAPLFNYVYGYLGVYERATGLLRGEALGPPDEARDASDRDLLLTGKAYVFRTGLRPYLGEVVRPMLAASDGPAVVVDMNAGDGTVLAAIADMAPDGNAPALVALVRNELAAVRCRAALEGVEAQSTVLQVDFSDADAVERRLRDEGFALAEALVVSKTTIHDRRFSDAAGTCLAPARGLPSEAVFVSPEGDWIEPAAMEDDLAAFFARWRRHLGRHGMVAMDTHATPPDVAAQSWEENAVTHVTASHGYSSQYLIECDRFREAARRAGLSTLARKDLGTDRVGAVTMSLDHFVPS